jgi:hypothetical protein
MAARLRAGAGIYRASWLGPGETGHRWRVINVQWHRRSEEFQAGFRLIGTERER